MSVSIEDVADVVSLEELKKQNEAEEGNAPEELPDASEPEAPEAKDEPETADDAPDGEPEEKKDIPAFMKSEDEPEKKFVPNAEAAQRRKSAKALRGQLREEQEKASKLEQELVELRQQIQQPKPTTDKPAPENYGTDAEFQEALIDWKLAQKVAETQSAMAVAEQRQTQEARMTEMAAAVDSHYDRAAELITKSGISEDTYQMADRIVRQAIDAIYPKGGDVMTDALIESMGDGSEKVIYHLGVNASKRGMLADMLRADKSGRKALVYLGKLNAELSMPTKRDSRAPEPAAEISGDKKGGNANSRKMKEEYKKAHDKGDAQKAFDLKRAAKVKGVSTADW
jgi:hypothetical protein